jgi:hypothetical protein
VTSKANLVHDLAEKIGKKLAEAELKGAEGQVLVIIIVSVLDNFVGGFAWTKYL